MPRYSDQYAGSQCAAALRNSLRGNAFRPLCLLVDDVPEVLTTTSSFLEAEGFDVVQASTGLEALISLASGPTFALLVTDYCMPGPNGAELAAQAVKIFPGLKVLIITGFSNVEDLAKLTPGVALLRKPFRRAALIAQLQKWFGNDPPCVSVISWAPTLP
jgi:CheY-like chemotaxis protein